MYSRRPHAEKRNLAGQASSGLCPLHPKNRMTKGPHLSYNQLCYSGNGFNQHLYPAWRCVDLMKRMGIISADEAARWKRGLFELMVLWELEPDDPIGAQDRFTEDLP